jgi:predicted PurR-regulated permease PerM
VRFSHWLRLVVIGICLFILWLIRNVLLLVLTAIILVVVLNRAVGALQKYIPDRRVAVFLSIGGLLLLLTLFGLLVIPAFLNQFQALIALIPSMINQSYGWTIAIMGRIPGFSVQNRQDLENVFNQLRAINLELIFGQFYMLFSNTLSIAFNLLIVLMLVIMMLLNPGAYRQLFLRLFPYSLRSQVGDVLDNCEVALSGWFIGISFTMALIALMSLVGLLILDIPLALANGILAGLLAFIPNLGLVISVVPPVALALLETPWKAIAVIILYLVIQQVERHLTPLVIQKRVSLLPAVALLSQVFFAVFFGFLGLLLALPLTLIIQQWLQEFWEDGFLKNT